LKLRRRDASAQRPKKRDASRGPRESPSPPARWTILGSSLDSGFPDKPVLRCPEMAAGMLGRSSPDPVHVARRLRTSFPGSGNFCRRLRASFPGTGLYCPEVPGGLPRIRVGLPGGLGRSSPDPVHVARRLRASFPGSGNFRRRLRAV